MKKMKETNKTCMPDSFCSLPWTHFSTHTNGGIRMCCGGIYVRTNDGENVNARNTNLEQILNSPVYKKVRKEMLEGKQPKECNYCWRDEKVLQTSYRINSNRMMGADRIYNNALKFTENDGTLDLKKLPPEFYDLRLSNKCSQKCRSCGPISSGLWYNDYVALYEKMKDPASLFSFEFGYLNLLAKTSEKDKKIDNRHKVDKIKYKEITNTWGKELNDDLKKGIHSIRWLYFAGGEPLIHNDMWEILRECIDSNCAKDIVVKYSTNFFKLPGFAWDIWKHFSRVELYCSIDGYGDQYNYIRYPGKWNIIKKNIEKIYKERSSTNVYALPMPVISILNIFSVLDLQEWLLKNVPAKSLSNSHFDNRIRVSILDTPSYLDIRIFSDKAKKIINEKYIKFMDKHQGTIFKDEFEKILKYLNTSIKHKELPKSDVDFSSDLLLPSASRRLRENFFKATYALDEIRNESFEKTFPEISELLRL